MKDDKFILMGIDDERSKDIAEVLSNKTCKKILDFLADTKEASEKDISDELNIPINTVEYNLNKLIKSGLVEKSKNFFWSRKGRKIDMYKIVKKHIIISPRSTKLKMNELKTIIPIIFAAGFILLIAILFWNNGLNKTEKVTNDSSDSLKQFAGMNQLIDFLNSSSANYAGREEMLYADSNVQKSIAAVTPSAAGAGVASSESSDSSASSYSSTNVQVEGVDEPDIVKNDDKYIYTLSGNKIVIVKAYPALDMDVVSEIKVNGASNIFLNQDKLVVFSNNYNYIPYAESDSYMCLGKCGGYNENTNVFIYDITDRSNPKLINNISFDGNYVDSRMIDNYVYLISTKSIIMDRPIMPMYSINGEQKTVELNDVYYFDYYDSNYVFTSIFAIDLDSESVNSKSYITGYSNNLYVSENNIYLTYQKSWDYEDYIERQVNEVYLNVLPDSKKDEVNQIMDSSDSKYQKQRKIQVLVMDYSLSLKGVEKELFDSKLQSSFEEFNLRIEKERDKSIIHKISIDKSNIEYKSAGEVPGHILNQFSMDEYNGYLRVATTTGDVWGGNSLNHLYILDDSLDIVGRVEDLAKGEKIYSARFIGKRAYIVTFKKVDPLFVIDVSNPEVPKVLGYLKIPGYSDYLHPYDENHVIGIGKDARDASSEEVSGRNLDFAWYQGVKISLFDVTDVENPKEKANYVIGDRGTDSPVSYDHKALLFNKEKKLLVIPVSVAEINRSKYRECSPEEQNSPRAYNYCLTDNTYGEQVWQGVYVLDIDTTGISLRGKITHNNIQENLGPAKLELVGATRKDYQGNVWTKIAEDTWTTDAEGYEDTTYINNYIDSFPGGINNRNYFDYNNQIQRSLFMDDYLYTVSNSKIKANDLNTISEIKSVDLGYSYDYYPRDVVY
jgi:inhibitor of cysteine peptidase